MSDLRTLEADSIRAFVEQAGADGYLSGRVLDFGCGKAPYRALVQSFGAEWVGYDRGSFPASVAGDVGEGNPLRHRWDAILLTQVIEYEPFPRDLLSAVGSALVSGGYLVATYPTAWPETESEDLWHLTKAGMERLLTEAGFEIVRHEPRHVAAVTLSAEELVAGYGCIARAA